MSTPAEHPDDHDCFAVLSTPRGPGAIAVVDLIGDVRSGLRRLFPDRPLAIASLSHRAFGDFDDGVVALLSDDRAQLCPHGGSRVLQRLRDWLGAHGIGWLEDASSLDPMELFPEAGDRVEAHALAAMTRSASRLAVRLLVAQSEIWKARPPQPDDLPRSRRLRHLLVPPRVVLLGAPNAGKSTLSNAIVGRTMAIASPEPGTTRDYLSARVDLNGLVVDWFDTPGVRTTSDEIERAALDLSRSVIAGADVLLLVAPPGGAWPEVPPARCAESDRSSSTLLRVLTKCDLDPNLPRPVPAADHEVSAFTGAGIPELIGAIRDCLVPEADLASDRPWIFDERLFPGS